MATRLIHAMMPMAMSAISHTKGTLATAPKYTHAKTSIRKTAVTSQWLLMNWTLDSA
ncbi:Uncharacterised protein [Mycobacteroides abscessus subsp. massiliense]|nr:Uncharacterised protein [Mycobacteroides abscessus subsp. massiliense]